MAVGESVRGGDNGQAAPTKTFTEVPQLSDKYLGRVQVGKVQEQQLTINVLCNLC